MKEFPTFREFGERAILISWEAIIDDKTHRKVMRMDAFLNENFNENIVETVPTYHSLAVFFKKGLSGNLFIKKIKKEYSETVEIPSDDAFIFKIPVCYDAEFAPDLKYVAEYHSLSEKEVVKLHTEALYKIYFLGFLPGFPYLGGLPETLSTPRRKSPRQYIEEGSVATGGSQAGIYTVPSPGGWHIIGKSPLRFFNVEKSVPVLLQAGDYIQFVPIDKNQMKRIETEVELGIYHLEKEVYND
jgi:inhibitor of KinA